jgi:hypothetical protein
LPFVESDERRKALVEYGFAPPGASHAPGTHLAAW